MDAKSPLGKWGNEVSGPWSHKLRGGREIKPRPSDSWLVPLPCSGKVGEGVSNFSSFTKTFIILLNRLYNKQYLEIKYRAVKD